MYEGHGDASADLDHYSFLEEPERGQGAASDQPDVLSKQQFFVAAEPDDHGQHFVTESFEPEDHLKHQKQINEFEFIDLHQHTNSSKIQDIKSPKTSLNIANLPLSGTTKNQSLKMKQIQQRASGILMQRCESHQTINHQSQKQQDGSLSPIEKGNNHLQRTGKHQRQNSIVNFNMATKLQQKSLSPGASDTTKHHQKQHNHCRVNTERVKSLDNESLEAISRAIANGSYEYSSVEKQKRLTQHIRISPQKQFIVQSCTQQTSPSEQYKKTQLKLQRKVKESKNLILEQEDYLLPTQENMNDYSITNDMHGQLHNEYVMKMSHSKKAFKESEESINKGFITDRMSTKNEVQIIERKKKTKGISYTRNAQELKKLLLETGVLGGMSFVGQSSLATAAAGMISTQETQIKSDHGKNEVFCLSARNKSNKQFTVGSKQKGSCLLEKKQHQRIQQQLESSVQTHLPGSHILYQTLDKQSLQFPQSTTNQMKLKEFILNDDDDFPHTHLESDQVIYQKYSPYKPHESYLRKSPSSQLRDSCSTFPFQETEQFILKNSKKHFSSVVNDQQKTLTRCWTAQEDLGDKENYYSATVTEPVKDKSPKSVLKQSKHRNVSGQPTQKHSIGKGPNKSNPVQEYQQKKTNHMYSSVIGESNMVDSKELEIMKFKMIAFIKTYENEFRKMKEKMTELASENKSLKKKLNGVQKRRLSANTNQNSQYSSIALTKGFMNANPMCLTSTHNSQIHM